MSGAIRPDDDGRRLRAPLVALAVLAAAFLVLPAIPGRAEEAGKPPAHYGRTPDDLVPYRRIAPYFTFFTEPPAFHGPGREKAEPTDFADVPIGLLVPSYGADYNSTLGARMQNGVEMAVAEANAAGGYKGRPFRLVTRRDTGLWGAVSNEIVRFAVDDQVWAILGSVADEANHVAARVLLKVEVPMVNTAGTDPTLTEHAIPWFVRVRTDDRQNGYRLAKEIFRDRGHKSVALLRANSRYGRVGVKEFVDAAKRLGHPVHLEVRFAPGDVSAEAQIERIKSSGAESVLLWGDPVDCGRFLAQMRALGLDVPVYGPDRLVDAAFIQAAGKAAEGATAAYPFDLERDDPAWKSFAQAYRARFNEEPTEAAAYGYDGARYLLGAIGKAGLNRPRIRDALMEIDRFDGATGAILMDPTRNNVAWPVLARVKDGRWSFR